MHKTRLIRRIGSAHVIGGIALFVALGGTSVAKEAVHAFITGADVRNGSLTGRDVRNRSLTGRDVRDRSLTAADLAPGVLRAGATGPAGPQGPAGPPGPAGPDLAGATHVRVGGDRTPAENGAALRAALASITDASATRPYVIQLAPGVYELGPATLAMKPDVSIAGAGAEATRITGDHGKHVLSEALVLGADRTVLRDVTITNRGAVDALLHNTLTVRAATMRIEDAVLDVRSVNNHGYALVVAEGSSVEVRDSRLESDSATVGYAATVVGASHAWIRGSELVADSAATAFSLSVHDGGTSAVVENSALVSTGQAVRGITGSVWVGGSRVVGGGSGLVTCVGSYNASFQTLNDRCN